MSGNNIPLEGRTRLPGKIQDCIQDCGLIISHIQIASRSNEACILSYTHSKFIRRIKILRKPSMIVILIYLKTSQTVKIVILNFILLSKSI